MGAGYAGEQKGVITQLNARYDGVHWVRLSGVHNNRPGCAVNQTYWMVKDENSQAGKTQISMLMSAYMKGEVVMIDGLNTCTRWGDGEDIATVTLTPNM